MDAPALHDVEWRSICMNPFALQSVVRSTATGRYDMTLDAWRMAGADGVYSMAESTVNYSGKELT